MYNANRPWWKIFTVFSILVIIRKTQCLKEKTFAIKLFQLEHIRESHGKIFTMNNIIIVMNIIMTASYLLHSLFTLTSAVIIYVANSCALFCVGGTISQTKWSHSSRNNGEFW